VTCFSIPQVKGDVFLNPMGHRIRDTDVIHGYT
jgi:hypothetical protein